MVSKSPTSENPPFDRTSPLQAKKLSGLNLATSLMHFQLAKPDERVLMTTVTTMQELAALAVTWGNTRPQQPQVNLRWPI